MKTSKQTISDTSPGKSNKFKSINFEKAASKEEVSKNLDKIIKKSGRKVNRLLLQFLGDGMKDFDVS